MSPTMSRIVGKTERVGMRMGYEVYEATGDLIVCFGCDRRLAPGERFTRRMMPGGGSRRYPFCHNCEPFEVAPDAS